MGSRTNAPKAEHTKKLELRRSPAPIHLNVPKAPSNLLSNLVSIHTHTKARTESITRSASFSEVPTQCDMPSYHARDDRLALVEKLASGPGDHTAPIDDPHFEFVEPNSGIHLTSRKLSHADLHKHLQGRYYLSPSLLYSVIRPLPSNQGYDVPVPGDWLTIAVIAERGPIKFTATSRTVHYGDDLVLTSTKGGNGNGKREADSEDHKTQGKKYISMKLVDFGMRSHLSSAIANTQIRGDALLTLLLFESDSYSFVEDENRAKTSKAERQKVYRGGSGGAFEACMKLHEGAVIAILNPKILKPYQRNSTAPHPTDNVLAITPMSAQSIAIIGRSRDLGMCGVTKRDGKTCGSWCDKRVSDCCEYHVEHAVQRSRAGRAEFSIGTSGMTMAAQSRKPAFDPDRKWGLLPSADCGASRSNSSEGGSTYVMSGHVISAFGPEYVGEKIGRAREERAKRKREEKKADEVLNRLLVRNGGGGDRNAAAGAVRKAREVMKSMKSLKNKEPPGKDKAKQCRMSTYSAETIKRLGFDPAIKGHHEGDGRDIALKRKLDSLAALQRNCGQITLGPRPGKRTRTNVPGAATALDLQDGKPEDTKEEGRMSANPEPKLTLEESDDDLEIEPPATD